MPIGLRYNFMRDQRSVPNFGDRTNSVDSVTSKIVAMVEPRVKGHDCSNNRQPRLRQSKEEDEEDDDTVREEIIRERKNFLLGREVQKRGAHESHITAKGQLLFWQNKVKKD